VWAQKKRRIPTSDIGASEVCPEISRIKGFYDTSISSGSEGKMFRLFLGGKKGEYYLLMADGVK